MLLTFTFAALAAQSTAVNKPICQDVRARMVESHTRRPRVHPLSQEPNAQQTLTVLRVTDGCTRPVTVREDVGIGQKR